MCKDIWHHAGYARYMAISMAKTVQEERWRWIRPILEKEVRLADILRACPHSRRSLCRWMAAYRMRRGMAGLIPRSTAPCTSPKETPIRTKERVIALRKNRNLCALKLHWLLKEEGILLPPDFIHLWGEDGLVCWIWGFFGEGAL